MSKTADLLMDAEYDNAQSSISEFPIATITAIRVPSRISPRWHSPPRKRANSSSPRRKDVLTPPGSPRVANHRSTLSPLTGLPEEREDRDLSLSSTTATSSTLTLNACRLEVDNWSIDEPVFIPGKGVRADSDFKSQSAPSSSRVDVRCPCCRTYNKVVILGYSEEHGSAVYYCGQEIPLRCLSNTDTIICAHIWMPTADKSDPIKTVIFQYDPHEKHYAIHFR